MDSDNNKFVIFAVGIISIILIFVIVLQVGGGFTSGEESEEVEPLLSPNHKETVHVGNSIPPVERASSKEQKEAGQTPYGSLQWQPKKKKEEPEKKPSTYEEDQSKLDPARDIDGGE